MKEDTGYMIGAVLLAGVIIFLYRQHQRQVIEKIKANALVKPAALTPTEAANALPQGAAIQPILINAPASMFEIPVNRNNEVIVPVNLPPGVTPAII